MRILICDGFNCKNRKETQGEIPDGWIVEEIENKGVVTCLDCRLKKLEKDGGSSE